MFLVYLAATWFLYLLKTFQSATSVNLPYLSYVKIGSVTVGSSALRCATVPVLFPGVDCRVSCWDILISHLHAFLELQSKRFTRSEADFVSNFFFRMDLSQDPTRGLAA